MGFGITAVASQKMLIDLPLVGPSGRRLEIPLVIKLSRYRFFRI